MLSLLSMNNFKWMKKSDYLTNLHLSPKKKFLEIY